MSFDDLKHIIAQSSNRLNHDNKLQIMFVDDDKDLLDDLALFFKDEYDVILCENGKDAVAKLKPEIHCVVLDIRMPDNDGFATFLDIKKKYSHIPIIFYSAYQNLKDPFTIINEYKPFGYVCKGNDSKELEQSIQGAIDYYSQITANKKLAQQLQQEILQRQSLEKQRNTLITELKNKSTELEELNHILVHDLKSPLFSIKMFMGYLEHDLNDSNLDKLSKDIERIHFAADRMKKILDDLVKLFQQKHY